MCIDLNNSKSSGNRIHFFGKYIALFYLIRVDNLSISIGQTAIASQLP